jgi:hypothetical protein
VQQPRKEHDAGDTGRRPVSPRVSKPDSLCATLRHVQTGWR